MYAQWQKVYSTYRLFTPRLGDNHGYQPDFVEIMGTTHMFDDNYGYYPHILWLWVPPKDSDKY